jgi:NAD(P)-dependent dehydrogenase (short-subunit alcohol dehydrogenase family)
MESGESGVVVNRVSKRVVVVTGASRGIGAAVVRRLAARGYPTVVVYRVGQGQAEEVCREAAALGARSIAVQADVASEPDVVRLFEQVEAELGPVGGLVNNAGLNGGRHAIADFVGVDLEYLFRVNVVGTMLCTREAVKRMSRSRGGAGGVVVNISSMAATVGGRPGLSHYAASKAAVDAFTVGAARELAPEGIRVYGIRPGATVTDLTEAGRRDPVMRVAIERSIAMGRYAEPDEIAEPVAALFGDGFAYLSGAVIDAGGGGYVLA